VKLFVDFVAALQFLTVLPPLLRRPFSAAEMGRAVAYYPLVGLLLGALLAGTAYLLDRLFPEAPAAALLLVSWVALTGALHLDGFLDCCDGLLGGATPERRLEIMRDHHIGAFAFAGGALLMLVKFAALGALAGWKVPALLVAPMLGRWAMTMVIAAFPYARPAGLGREIKTLAVWRQALFASIITLLVAWLFAGWRGLAALALALLVLLALARFAMRRIPGLTGDVYGAVCEMVELAVLLLFAARGLV